MPDSRKKSRPIRVLLVDDHPVVKTGVKKELGRRRNIVVVGEAQNGEEALKALKACKPDVVLLDVSMPGLNGADVVRRIRRKGHRIKILIYTVHGEKGYVLEFARLGVEGYVQKTIPMEQLVRAIEQVNVGERVFPGFASQVIIQDYSESVAAPKSAADPSLTFRELQILTSIAEGKTNSHIANELKVSVRTVETHRERIKSKLGLHSTVELTKYAISKGIASL